MVVHARWRPRAAALLLTLAVGGCSGQSAGSQPARGEASAAREPAHATVLQPGRPGEAARTLPPDATVRQPRPNAVDVRFLQMMIPHHAQALRMCELARTRADDPQVAALARRIAGAQGPEILTMSAWLQEHGEEVPSAAGSGGEQGHGGHDMGGHGGHDMGGHAAPAAARMPGMLSPAQMRELAAASGPRFDRLFLEGMIRHHQGAVTMADRALARGSDIRVTEMATDVSVGQQAEIDRMRAILRDL